jgi:transcription antitermination factor NusG
MSKQWHAVYTKPHWEKKAAQHFLEQNIAHYCPLNAVQRQWADRKKIVHEPLFPSFVFVFISDDEKLKVLQTQGVMNFLYWLGKPAVVTQVEIDNIRRFLDEHKRVTLEKTEVSVNDTVRLLRGAQMDKEDTVVSLNNNTVRLCLPSLGYIMIAEVDKANLTLVYKHPAHDQHAIAWVNTKP